MPLSLHAELLRALIESEASNTLDFLRKRLNNPSASRQDLDSEYQFLTRLLRSEKSFSLAQFERLNDLIHVDERRLVEFRPVLSRKKNVVKGTTGNHNNISIEGSATQSNYEDSELSNSDKNKKAISRLELLIGEVIENQQYIRTQLVEKDKQLESQGQQISKLIDQNQKLIDKLL